MIRFSDYLIVLFIYLGFFIMFIGKIDEYFNGDI